MTDWTNLQESRNIDEKNFIPTEFNNWIEILKLEHIKQMTTTVKINTVYFLFDEWFLIHSIEWFEGLALARNTKSTCLGVKLIIWYARVSF